MKKISILLVFVACLLSGEVLGQTPNNCNEYTSTGTTSSGYGAGTNAACNALVPGTVTGTGAWTGSGCTGFITSTVTGPPVTCLTISYAYVNTDDFGVITTDTGGALTITGVNVAVVGTTVGPYTCPQAFPYGDVSITICSTIPFNSVTLTNSGCSSGWVVNCVTQSNPCDPAWTLPTPCESDPLIDLDALITGATGGTWTGLGVTGSNFDPAVGTTNVMYTAPCGDSLTQLITVQPNGDATWTVPVGICSDAAPIDLDLLVTGLLGGTWSGTGVTGNMFDPSAGSQTVTYTSGVVPCDDVSAQLITIDPAPDPAWTTITMCASDAPVNLNNQITGTTGGTWSGTGVTGNVFDPFFGTQTITYDITVGACAASSVQQLTVVDPQLTLTSTNASCFGLTDGTLGVTVAGGSGTYTYGWNTAPPQTTANATNVGAGTYTVVVVDGTCIVTDSITIIEPAEIMATMSATQGCAPSLGSAQVAPSGGVGGFTYAWTPSLQTTATALLLDSAMHTVTVTDGNGCTYVDSILVQIFPPPVVTVTADTTIEYGNSIQLNATGGVSYYWDPIDNLDCSDCPNPVANPLEDKHYCVTATDANGCSNETCMTLSVVIVCGEVFVPSAFSPNDDGENDILCVYSDCMESMTFTLFNRWGEKVYQTNNMSVCWDGTWNGKPLNSAVFVYTLDGYLINGELIEQKGNVSLIR